VHHELQRRGGERRAPEADERAELAVAWLDAS
jgi:hypothetical protein